MNELLQQILLYLLSYLAVFVLAIVIISVLLRGFFWTYMRVKSSRGKLVLVKVRGVSKPYYRAGKVQENFLVYKTAEKNEKRIKLERQYIYNDLGISWVEVDSVTDGVYDPSKAMDGVTGFDADRMNSLYLRALYRPNILDPRTQIMFVLIILTFFLGLIILGAVLFNINKTTAVFENVESIRGLLYNQSLVPK